MAKPEPAPLATIVAMKRYSGRPAGLAHVTLLPFADLGTQPEGFLEKAIEAMRGFEADAFHLAFDRIVERKGVMLYAGWTQQNARGFQRRVADFLRRRGFMDFEKAPVPHLTINYRPDGQGNGLTERIGWRVDEVLLVESLHGLSRHEVRGRWPLNPLLV